MIKRHDDPFFEMFREGLQGYEATPPAGAHAAIKQRMSKGSFFHFAWNRLNVYYAALLLGAGIAATFVLNNDGGMTKAQTALMPHTDSELVLHAVQVRLADQNVDARTDEDDDGQELLLASLEHAKSSKTSVNPFTKPNPSDKSPVVDNPNSDINAGKTDEPLVQDEPLQAALPIEMIEATSVDSRLPIDWMNHLKSPNISSLLNQLDSDNETIHITLPVTVTVEK